LKWPGTIGADKCLEETLGRVWVEISRWGGSINLEEGTLATWRTSFPEIISKSRIVSKEMEILLNREILEEVRITHTAILAFKTKVTILDLIKCARITLLVEQVPKTPTYLSSLKTTVGRAR
jgi:hypothetical protein